jgi:RNA polymerase sigma-70 factor, ECF subfamily
MSDNLVFEHTAIPCMPLLYDYALKLTVNSDEAKDLLKETYLRAYRFWNKFEDGTNVKSWLYRVMKRSYFILNRVESKQPPETESNGRPEVAGSPDTLALTQGAHEDIPLHDVFEDEIVRCVESLQGIFRSAVMLDDAEELRYAEMAEMVSCPVGTVRSRLHKSRRSVQKNLLNFARANGMIQ